MVQYQEASVGQLKGNLYIYFKYGIRRDFALSLSQILKIILLKIQKNQSVISHILNDSKIF